MGRSRREEANQPGRSLGSSRFVPTLSFDRTSYGYVCKLINNVVCIVVFSGALAWNGEQLSSGSRDRVILQRDVRAPPAAERRLQGHRQEVCGLKWSPDHQHLASGGNDNKVRMQCERG